MEKNGKIFWLLIVSIHVVFLMYSLRSGNVFMKDSPEYLQQADNLRHQASWYCGDLNDAIVPELYSQRTPLYGFFIMLIQFFTHNLFAITITQTLLSIINIFICCKIIKKISPSFRFSIVAIPLLFFPSQFIYSNLIMSEMLLQTSVMAAAYFLIRFSDNENPRYLFLYVISITAALLIKPVFVLFPVVSLVYFVLIKKSRFRIIFASHLLPAITIIFISYSNYRNTGYFEYSSIARKLAINYHALYVTSADEGNERALVQVDSIQNAAASLPTYAEKAGAIQSGAGRLISKHLVPYIYLTSKGILMFFVDHGRYDIDSFLGRPPMENQQGLMNSYRNKGFTGILEYISAFNIFYLLYLLMCMIVGVCMLYGLVRFTFSKNIDLKMRLIITFIIFYVAVLTGMTGTTRFRLPVFLLIVAANAVVFKSLPFFQRRRSPESE